MKLHTLIIGMGLTLFVMSQANAQDNLDNLTDTDLFDLSLEDLLSVDVDKEESFNLYGFIQSNFERVYSEPSVSAAGRTVTQNAPAEFSPVQNFHLYGSGRISDRISVLFNIAAPGGNSFEVRNAWGNFKITDAFQIRAGRMYRRFGLYNERLDQIPTFIGIEAPELFDVDHLFLTRTTSFMIHGTKEIGRGDFSYAFTSENSEGGPTSGVIPIGWDFRWKSDEMQMIIGTSGFASNFGDNLATSTVGPNSGSPRGGVLPWMAGDKYKIFGGFIEKKIGNLLIQMEYWNGDHNAIRDPESTLDIVLNAGINERQRENFLGPNEGILDADLTVDDIVTTANYTVQTFYVRFGYNIQSKVGQFVPYVFFDWMSNPEVIRNKSFGGDNEAGLADDGKFSKPSIGVVYRPVQNVAIKLDGSLHTQEFNGRTESYPEIRLDFSFAFDALKGIWNN